MIPFLICFQSGDTFPSVALDKKSKVVANGVLINAHPNQTIPSLAPINASRNDL